MYEPIQSIEICVFTLNLKKKNTVTQQLKTQDLDKNINWYTEEQNTVQINKTLNREKKTKNLTINKNNSQQYSSEWLQIALFLFLLKTQYAYTFM